MTFRALYADSRSDRESWVEILERWPGREVFAHPAYVELFAEEYGRTVALLWQADGATVLFPLILRSLNRLDWYEGPPAWDATSPYGYGGPYHWGAESAGVEEFWEAVSGWARQQGLAATFARLSVFDDQLALPAEGVLEVTRNIVRTLDLDEEAMWRDYAHKVRKNVQRARRDGVEILVDDTGKRLDDFLDIYLATMDRRSARSQYYFSREFFSHIVTELPGEFVFFHALLGADVVSTELVLVSAHHIYSYLGGTKSDAFSHRPNDLLKHAIIEWGGKHGKKAFGLGGGMAPKMGSFDTKSHLPRTVLFLSRFYG